MYYYQHHIGDYRKDTSHLTLLEHGIYRQLLDLYYTNELPLSLDHAYNMRLVCVRTADESKAYENVLKDFFVQCEDGFHHKRCDDEILKFHGKSEKSRDAAYKRWGNNANALPTHSERNAIGDANQEPRTKNQEPIKEPLSSKPDLIAVLQYLNEKANRDFQPVPANLKLIESRLKEGATVETCKKVIDSKVAEWLNDKKMVEYLRPATLFNATNFAQYVGQVPKNAQVKREWQEGERNGDLIYEKYIGWRKLTRIELLAEQKAKESAGANNAGN